MGVSVYLHVGLVVKFKSLPKEQYTYSDTVCINKQCDLLDKSAQSRFCPECGEEIVQKDFHNESEIDLYDWIEENDVFSVFSVPPDNSTNYNILTISSNSIHLDGWENMGFHSLKEIAKPKHIEEFKETPHYKKLKDSFGEDNFTIEFGIMKTAG